MPEVTIVTPIHDRAALVPALVATVRAQTHRDWELIVVDDASPEPVEPAVTAAAEGDPRVRVIRLPANAGPSAARNAGMEARRGAWVAFLDSDDEWAPTKLERQMEAARGDPRPEWALAVTRTRVVHGGRRGDAVLPVRPVAPGERFGTFLYVANGFAQCSSFLLGAALAERLRFEPSLRQYEDHLAFLVAGALGARHVLAPEALVTWRNDDRADRLGAADDEARGRAFLALARGRGLLDDVETLAFELRCLGPTVARRSRVEAARLALRGARERSLPREAWAKVLAQAAIGPGAYARLRAARGRRHLRPGP